MDRLLESLTSPFWWVSAGIAGLAMSLLSAYLKDWIDASLSRLLVTWRIRSEAERQARRETILRLRGNDHEQVIQGLMMLDDLGHTQLLLLVAIFFVLLPILGPAFLREDIMPAPILAVLLAAILITLFTALRFYFGAADGGSALVSAMGSRKGPAEPS